MNLKLGGNYEKTSKNSFNIVNFSCCFGRSIFSGEYHKPKKIFKKKII